MRKEASILFLFICLFSSCCTKKGQSNLLTPALRNLFNYQIGQKLIFMSQNDTIEISVNSKSIKTLSEPNSVHFSPCKIEDWESENLTLTLNSNYTYLDSMSLYVWNRPNSGKDEYEFIFSQRNFGSSMYLDGNAAFLKSKSDTTSFLFSYLGKSYSPVFRTMVYANYRVPEVLSYFYFVDKLGFIGFDTKDGKEYRLVQ